MPVAAPLIIAGGAIGGALISSNAAKSAANAQVGAEEQALSLQQQQLQQLSPWENVGAGANYTLGQLYGIGGQGANPGGSSVPYAGASQGVFNANNGAVTGVPSPNSPNYTSFFNSPDYQFAQQQGNAALQNYMNANGLAGSGGALAAASQYNQGLATQQYGNYFNRLMNLSQLGESAAATGVSGANGAASTLGNIGASQASGIVGSANAVTGGINSGITNSLLFSALKGGGFGGVGTSSPSAYPSVGNSLPIPSFGNINPFGS